MDPPRDRPVGSALQRLKIERHAGGVHVEIETQDDHGYYQYEFDVMR